MWTRKQISQEEELEQIIGEAEAVLAKLREEEAQAERVLEESTQRAVAPQLEDTRPIGIPAADGERMQVARFVFVDKTPEREWLEANLVRWRGAVSTQERHVVMLRNRLKVLRSE